MTNKKHEKNSVFNTEKTAKKLKLRVIKAFLDLLILAKLENCSPMGGHEIIKWIHKKHGITIRPGIIYSNLYSLERREVIAGRQKKRRKVYKITEKGKRQIDAVIKNRTVIQRSFAIILDARIEE
jgi:DNA-binding PadR family transcriptional regulator